MTWVRVAIGGSAVVGAGAGIYGANQASNAQQHGANQAIHEQQREYNTALQLLEPQRYLGYQAGADLSHLYGWATSGYQPASQVISGNFGQPISVHGGSHGGGGGGLLNTLSGGLLGSLLGGGGGKKQRGASIDPTHGTVDIPGDHVKQEEWLNHYLQTGEWTGGKGGKLHDIRNAIDQLRGSGWQYDPTRTIQGGGAGSGTGTGGYPGSIAGTPAGAPNMDRFFTSPDFTYRQQQQSQAVQRSAAAGSGALNPNTSVALMERSGQLASGEYGNYVSRLMQAAGLGSAATSQAVQTGQQTATNIGNAYQNQADARASGVLGGVNAGLGAINSGLNAWLLNRGGYFNKGP